jgi:hypothetical protein
MKSVRTQGSFKFLMSRDRNITNAAVLVTKCPVTGLEWPRGFPDYMKTAQDGGKVVSLTHRPPLPPENAPGTHFC